MEPLRHQKPTTEESGAATRHDIQGTIDQTIASMQSNLQKGADRGDHLNTLQDKTDNLATSAQGFRRGANRVRKQMWWKDMKMRMCIIAGIIILIVIVIVVPSKLATRQ